MPAARITATMGTAEATGPSGTLSLESSPILARRLAESGIEVDDYEARKAALVGSK